MSTPRITVSELEGPVIAREGQIGYEYYKIHGVWRGRRVGYLGLRINNSGVMPEDPYLREFDYDIETGEPLTVVSYQCTFPLYRERGFNRALVERANRKVFEERGIPLASDDAFYGEDPYELPASMKVWQRLTEQGKAVYAPIQGMDRWKMLPP